MANPGILWTILAFVLVIGPLVFVHELGHYTAGRIFGVSIDTFAIGFGREVAGFTDRRGTRWKFGWLPLGGYVRFAGDTNAVSQPSEEWKALTAEEQARTFQAKPVWQRAIIVAAGPLVNLALALLIVSSFAFVNGEMRTPAIVGDVAERSAASHAGLKPGDKITAMGNRKISGFSDIVDYVRNRAGEQTRIQYVRNGSNFDVEATLGTATERDRFGNIYRYGQLGVINSDPVFERVSLAGALPAGARQMGRIIDTMVVTLGQVIAGRRSVKELGGPLAIAKVSGEQMSLGVSRFVFLIALVSINLGFINLLPVPMLDGGHLLFYAIEAVRRRPVGPAAQEWAFRGGLAAILALMLLVTFNDLGNFGVWRGLAGLIG